MSYYDNLPETVKIHIGHYIPYKRPIHAYTVEYKIFLQDWKNQCTASNWNGINRNLFFSSQEIPFLQNAFFRHQDLKQFYHFFYTLDKGITWKRKKIRRNTI